MIEVSRPPEYASTTCFGDESGAERAGQVRRRRSGGGFVGRRWDTKRGLQGLRVRCAPVAPSRGEVARRRLPAHRAARASS